MTHELSNSLTTPTEQKQKVSSSFRKKKVILIAGPTACGKTSLSVELAKRIDGEIISADSMQVYKDMNIGTAKATAEEQSEVKHHMIDVCDVSNPYNVAKFCEDAHMALSQVIIRNKVPIVVGGVGFYIHSFMYGPPKGPPSIPSVREKLEQDYQKFGAELLYDKLRMLDPEYAQTISLQDRQKIIRGLEIMTISNQKVSELPKPTFKDMPSEFDFRAWFIYYPRPMLYERIESRCDMMLEQGLLNEVKDLRDKGLLNNSSAANAIGYRQALEYLESDQQVEDYERFVQSFKKASRQYARRQFTWFRKEPHFRWMDQTDQSKESLIETILQDYEQSF